jgi:hypothetical protein
MHLGRSDFAKRAVVSGIKFVSLQDDQWEAHGVVFVVNARHLERPQWCTLSSHPLHQWEDMRVLFRFCHFYL